MRPTTKCALFIAPGRPENMLLVEPNDSPNLRSSCSGEDVVQPAGGLGRRGVPRLKLYGFHRSSGSDCGSPAGPSCSNARTGELMDEEEAGPPQYTAPEVRAPSYLGMGFHLGFGGQV